MNAFFFGNRYQKHKSRLTYSFSKFINKEIPLSDPIAVAQHGGTCLVKNSTGTDLLRLVSPSCAIVSRTTHLLTVKTSATRGSCNSPNCFTASWTMGSTSSARIRACVQGYIKPHFHRSVQQHHRWIFKLLCDDKYLCSSRLDPVHFQGQCRTHLGAMCVFFHLGGFMLKHQTVLGGSNFEECDTGLMCVKINDCKPRF